MIQDLMILVFGIIIGIIIGLVLSKNVLKTKTFCNECGFTTKNKDLRNCPKCGNPLK